VIQRLMPYLLVGAGSFIGGNARFILARWVGGMVDARFPLGTFLINIGGAFVLGLIGGLLADRALPHGDAIRLALGVGFCGGFTTFSTFEYETRPFEDGVWLPAVTNMPEPFWSARRQVRDRRQVPVLETETTKLEVEQVQAGSNVELTPRGFALYE
jgi:CrcB protein